MSRPYLEVTYRRGKPLAAYLYFARRPGDVSARTEMVNGDLIIDFAADGRAIGLEIVSPNQLDLRKVNAVLAKLNQPEATAEDFAPLPLAG